MKKFLAMMLALAMVMGMATISFAAASQVGSGATGLAASTEGVLPVNGAYGPYAYNKDTKVLSDAGTIEYGAKVYYMLTSGDSEGNKAVPNSGAYDADAISGLKMKEKWEFGEELVEDVNIVRKKVDVAASTSATLPANMVEGKYYAFVEIVVADSNSTSDADVIGTIELNKTKGAKVEDLVLDIGFNVFWANTGAIDAGGYTIAVDKVEKNHVVTYNYDDEVEIVYPGDVIFTVDVSGQSKNVLYFDSKYNAALANEYPYAELDFYNFGGTKFNRTGELFIPVSDEYATFIYAVDEDGTISEVRAEYDEYDEGYYINTRVLGSYVVSDMELIEDEVVVAPVVPVNPATGAAA